MLSGSLSPILGNVFGYKQPAPAAQTPQQVTTAPSTGVPKAAANPYAAPAQPVKQAQSTPPNQPINYAPTGNPAQATLDAYHNFFGGSELDPLSVLFKRLGVYMYPQLAQQAQFSGQLEPGRESAIQNFINWSNPASQQAMVSSYGHQAQEAANVGAQQAGAAQRAAGLGTGYQAGNAAAAGQSAANATGQYQQQINSPQYQQQLLASLLGAYGQGQQLPGLQNLMGINSQLLNQEQQTLGSQTGNPILGGVTGIIGSLAGGGALNGLFPGAKK